MGREMIKDKLRRRRGGGRVNRWCEFLSLSPWPPRDGTSDTLRKSCTFLLISSHTKKNFFCLAIYLGICGERRFWMRKWRHMLWFHTAMCGISSFCLFVFHLFTRLLIPNAWRAYTICWIGRESWKGCFERLSMSWRRFKKRAKRYVQSPCYVGIWLIFHGPDGFFL